MCFIVHFFVSLINLSVGCYEDPSRADGLRKGWPFGVGIWNVDSLTGRSGELVEALGERRIDISCVQEIRW